MQVETALKAGGASDPGLLREINEDRCHFDPARGLFIVVDGVGGQAAGEKAAESALATLRARLERETGAVETRVREAIALANNEVHRLASIRPEWRGMACVLTVAVVSNGEVVVGHVGDTRLYKLRGARIQKLTQDHSPVGEREDAGELSEREAMQHPRRNEVYRDVGSERHEPDDQDFIDVFTAPFEADAALLLCTDGLTDQVTSGAIQDLVEANAGRPYDVVRELVAAANDAGGKDNVTVVYVENHRFTRGEDTRDLSERRRQQAGPAAPEAAAWGPRSRRLRTAILTALVAVVAALALYLQRDRIIASLPLGVPDGAAQIVVAPGGSIAEAIARAVAGSEVVVEPGEYRERVSLKSNVRLRSRLSRAAVLRLPSGASETDPAIVATDVAGAEVSGFRIVGDAATPLGVGIVARNADVALTDLEVTGAQRAAIQFELGATGSLLASRLHDNPGVALVVRAGAGPRIAHNTLERNATSERAAASVLVEAGAQPSIVSNVFADVRPESIILPPGGDMAALARENWFVDLPDRRAPAAPRVPQRGRR